MEPEFWQDVWNKNEIAFHQRKVNPLLVNNIDKLQLKNGSRIFVPLCGKTLDMVWLLSKGYKVVGCELVEMAIQQFFDELNMQPNISTVGSLKIYKGNNIEIFAGNIFDVSKEILRNVDAIYDRAALVALPPKIRNRYTTHITNITNRAPQLLIVFEYNQELSAPPPFSIDKNEIENQYKNLYNTTNIETVEVAGGLKGKSPANENVWLLEKK